MSFLNLVIILNILWFGSAFILFGLKPNKTIRVFRPDIPNGDERTKLVKPAIQFLGGMNLGFVILCL
ncbi:MAG: hypothetical protein KC493_09290 [Bacteriovoracaceae bacterium]|nr:hypothetical protein [Bacteriovoracaceae bacterium]